MAWMKDAAPARISETRDTAAAIGKVLSSDAIAKRSFPVERIAQKDGFAVRASDTFGAGSYNPLPVTAEAVLAGDPIPTGFDAVLADPLLASRGPMTTSLASVTQGEGVLEIGEEEEAGRAVLQRATRLRPDHIALLRFVGTEEIAVEAPIKVALLVSEPKDTDHLSPLLTAMLVDCEVEVVRITSSEIGPDDWASAMTKVAKESDLVLTLGRTNCGANDTAAPGLDKCGIVHGHGIAVHPGGSAGYGFIGETPVLLIPGQPVSAICVMRTLCRALIGRSFNNRTDFKLNEKIASSAGVTTLVPLALRNGEAFPLAPSDGAHLLPHLNADGFTLIPADSEGLPAGARLELFELEQTLYG